MRSSNDSPHIYIEFPAQDTRPAIARGHERHSQRAPMGGRVHPGVMAGQDLPTGNPMSNAGVGVDSHDVWYYIRSEIIQRAMKSQRGDWR